MIDLLAEVRLMETAWEVAEFVLKNETEKEVEFLDNLKGRRPRSNSMVVPFEHVTKTPSTSLDNDNYIYESSWCVDANNYNPPWPVFNVSEMKVDDGFKKVERKRRGKRRRRRNFLKTVK